MSAGAMHVRMQGNMQYVFHDVCHIQIITYFYGWCTVLETLGPWCLPDKKLVVPREKLERQRQNMLFFSPLITTVEEVYLKNYIYREPINILEELNDQIHETVATVIPNVLRLARENLIKRARLFLQMKENTPYPRSRPANSQADPLQNVRTFLQPSEQFEQKDHRMLHASIKQRLQTNLTEKKTLWTPTRRICTIQHEDYILQESALHSLQKRRVNIIYR
ncbi:hypothetical protein GEV33_003743 [Tenebrio molitor]|uniref:Uncharacterized protein n=1 Tax=Tenebrio molitor TaxID=7067 RepID=A0A8J6HSY7_TENMO|nr:hypothetical protein GEV33_003743 [Tenebrio molitor]